MFVIFRWVPFAAGICRTCFVLVSVFTPSVSSLALVFLVAQLFVIVRRLRHRQLSACLCVYVSECVCRCVCVTASSWWSCVHICLSGIVSILVLCSIIVCTFCIGLSVCVFVQFNGGLSLLFQLLCLLSCVG